MYNNIDRLLGLHEHLSVLYVVDGYHVTFSTDDGDTVVTAAFGETIGKALNCLDKNLEDYTYIRIERLRR